MPLVSSKGYMCLGLEKALLVRRRTVENGPIKHSLKKIWDVLSSLQISPDSNDSRAFSAWELWSTQQLSPIIFFKNEVSGVHLAALPLPETVWYRSSRYFFRFFFISWLNSTWLPIPRILRLRTFQLSKIFLPVEMPTPVQALGLSTFCSVHWFLMIFPYSNILVAVCFERPSWESVKDSLFKMASP